MAERSWFVAVDGAQKGPYPEAQLRGLVMSGQVNAETLLWSDGMAEWQRAGSIPGLIPTPLAGGPVRLPLPGAPPRFDSPPSGGALEATFGVWALFGRSLLCGILFLLVIPAPWAVTSYLRWLVPHIRVPNRAPLAFTGQPTDIWYVIMGSAVLSYLAGSEKWYLELPAIIANIFLMWLIVRWTIANLASGDERLSIGFGGGALPYVGWNLFTEIAFITIIGWAWVEAAWLRWICRNIQGTRRAVIFSGGGWSILWRTFVFGLTAVFIIPIPWTAHWLARWFVSSLAVVERVA